MANIVEQLSSLSYGQIERMGERQLKELLQKARRATSGRLTTIEKRGYETLVPNIEDLKKTPHIAGMSTKQIQSELRRRKAFLSSERGSASSIQSALAKGYQRAQGTSGKLGGALSLSPSTVVYNPKDVVASKNAKGNTVYRTKEGEAVKLKYTPDGQPVLVPYKTSDPALYSKSQIRQIYKTFKKVYEDPAIKAANLPSGVVRVLVFYAQKGMLHVTATGKRVTSRNIADTLVAVYDSYVQKTRDEDLADEAVYNALDELGI